MKINIIARAEAANWGGDTRIIDNLVHGLASIGVSVEKTTDDVVPKGGENYVVTNTCLDQRAVAARLAAARAPYFVLPFHEDFLSYLPASLGFAQLVQCALVRQPYFGLPVTVQDIIDSPELARYFPARPLLTGRLNAPVLAGARAVLPSSEFERTTVLRDAPQANCRAMLYPTNQSDKFAGAAPERFARAYGIQGPYILQVGRLETRKNQLATILAARDIDLPLVFIATRGYQDFYEKLVINAIVRFRRHPTYIVSQSMPDTHLGPLKIVRMHQGEKLPWDMLESAYRGAIVNCHPAFYELPGLTYMESIWLGVKTICSTRTSIAEYVVGGGQPAQGLHWVDPTDVGALQRALMAAIHHDGALTATLAPKEDAEYAAQWAEVVRQAA